MISFSLFMGPPGCGKGTQASKLSKLTSFGSVAHLSTGDLLRLEIKSGSSIGNKIKESVDNGLLVVDSLVLEVLHQEILRLQKINTKFVILDGFPRTLVQAIALEELFSSDPSIVFDKVYWFDVETEILVERAVNRRICKSCGQIYNIKFKQPKVENVCDICEGELYQRNDDNEATIKDRITIYNRETLPLLKFYKDRGVYQRIDAQLPESEISNIIMNHLKKN